jgi:type IV pilus biogenesis protein CpaD/CtpE
MMVHLFKALIYRTIVVATVLLASCSGQDTSQSITLDENSKITSHSNSISHSTKTLSAAADVGSSSLANANAGTSQLLASLASQYPNGKLPDNRTAESVKLLAQNPRVFKKTAQLSHFSPSNKFNTAGYQTQSIRGSGDYLPVYRYQLASQYGTYLLSKFAISSKSLAQIINPNFLPEGPAFAVSEAYQTGLSPVYRFRNLYNNTQVDTIDAEDRDNIIANYANYFAYEGIAWHASTVQLAAG